MSEQIQERRIRLVLLDDHALFRASLSRFLELEPGFEVAGQCGNSAEALEVLRHSPVDVVLLDFNFGAERGEEFISAARRVGYRGRFLIVAGAANPRDAAVALRPGASGVFSKSEAPDRLVQAIRLVANGQVWVNEGVIQLLSNQSDQRSVSFLTGREQRVLLGIVGGLTNKRIADDIGLSEGSVKGVVQQLFCKARVRRRSQLVRVALEGSLGTVRQLAKPGRTGDADSDSMRPPAAMNLLTGPSVK
jgi:two-component system nitrate/nitrite response regulator NarL